MAAIDDFRLWFCRPLDPLRNDGHAGCIFAMIAFPLLEHFLRGSCGVSFIQGGLNQAGYDWVNRRLPDIDNQAVEFWNGYRNGLLHQVAFQQTRWDNRLGAQVRLPWSLISGHDPRPVYFVATQNHFFLNPIAFYDFVVMEIERDFLSCVRADFPLPQAQHPVYAPVPTAVTAGSVFQLGTGVIPPSNPPFNP